MHKLQPGEIVELEISDIGYEGKGIGRTNEGKVVFTELAVPGDRILAKITRDKKDYANAQIEKILICSSDRATPECEYFGTCNGCKMQNIKYEKQLQIKKQNVINAFERIGGFTNLEIPAVIPSGQIYFYRNKLEFSFSGNRWLTENEKDIKSSFGFTLGYHKPGFIDKVINIERCYLQSEVSNDILNFTHHFFKERDTSVYSTKTHSGLLRYLIIRESQLTNERMVIIFTSEYDDELIKSYSFELNQSIPAINSVINAISRTKAQAAIIDEYKVLEGKEYINERIGKYTYRIFPGSFFQTNSLQTEKLFETLVKLADFNKDEKVLDLYCGCGAISIFISGLVKEITGVELNDNSIESANENAEFNLVKNCIFIASDVKDYLNNLKELVNEFDTIILDPPRSGIHPKAAEYLNELKVRKIIYVSCNPATQARDIKLLTDTYQIKKMQPVDMFPHTFHIENIVKLELK